MPNSQGLNQHPQQHFPSDSVLRPIFFDWQRLGYRIPRQLELLQQEYGCTLSIRTFRKLRKRLGVPICSYTRGLTHSEVQARIRNVSGLGDDPIRASDSRSAGFGIRRVVQRMAAEEGLLISHAVARQHLIELDPVAHDLRWPGAHKPFRAVLAAEGWADEWAGDGHEKLASSALRLGDLSFPIYSIRDKFTGYLVALQAVPNARDRGTVAHVFLDAIEAEGGIPRKMLVDCGTETNEALQVQHTFRSIFSPNISMDDYPPFARIKSVHNTVIEGLWSKFTKDEGQDLRTVFLEGEGLFDPEDELQLQLARWLFSRLIQQRLDLFRSVWNYSRVRFQRKKLMPSGHVPVRARAGEYGGRSCLIPVPQAAIEQLRASVSPRLVFCGEQFEDKASEVFCRIGEPEVTRAGSWEVFRQMLEVMKAPEGEEES